MMEIENDDFHNSLEGAEMTGLYEKRIRLLIVDDIAEVRDKLRELTASEPRIKVVGEAGDGYAAIEAYTRLRPDVVSMNICMPRMDGITASERIREIDPEAAIFIVSVQNEPNYMQRALDAGVYGFIAKPPKKSEYVDTIIAGASRAEAKRKRGEVARRPGIAGRIEVLVASDASHQISDQLEPINDIDVIAEVRSGLRALQVYESLRPGVIIFGEKLIDSELNDAARLLRLRNPEAGILALVSDPSDFLKVDLGRIGVKSNLSTEASKEELSEAVRELALNKPPGQRKLPQESDQPNRPIRLLVVEDEPSLWDVMCATWNTTDDLQVVATAGTGIEGLERYELHLPDVVSTNISMPALDGIEMARLILDKHPEAKILFVTAHQSSGTAKRLKAAGAAGYLAKPCMREQLISAVRKVARGEGAFGE